ncbi:hypothetical protein GF358_04575 [Candidatus Woesearchaeota archaeon]|nr:hypothetical protein [Candidatus Woesearchaeota archaeon]
MIDQIINSLKRPIKKHKAKYRGNSYFHPLFSMMPYELGNTRGVMIQTKREDFLEINLSSDPDGEENLLELAIANTDNISLQNELEQYKSKSKKYTKVIEKILDYLRHRMDFGTDPAKAEVIIPYSKQEQKYVIRIINSLITHKNKSNQKHRRPKNEHY